jgi:hypothetical protein
MKNGKSAGIIAIRVDVSVQDDIHDFPATGVEPPRGYTPAASAGSAGIVRLPG